jgi:hypothetical protein
MTETAIARDELLEIDGLDVGYGGLLGVTWRVSALTTIVLLFVGGYKLASYSGSPPWRLGLVMVGIGVALVGLTIALGG